MEKTIKKQLTELAEEDYKVFSSKLLPGINNILGGSVTDFAEDCKRDCSKRLAKLSRR